MTNPNCSRLRGPQFLKPASLLSVVLVFLGCALADAEGPGSHLNSTITATELVQRMQAQEPLVILDVRSVKEFGAGHIPGAINIPHGELPTRFAELHVAKSDELVVYCKSGYRAGVAEKALRDAGYSNLRDLKGHWRAWVKAGHPVTSP